MGNQLNENIKKFRLAHCMSQVDLAKALNVSKQCISNWENDNIQPSIDMLIKLSDFFHVSTDQMLGRTAKNVIDVSRLTDSEIAHVTMLVKDLEK